LIKIQFVAVITKEFVKKSLSPGQQAIIAVQIRLRIIVIAETVVLGREQLLISDPQAVAMGAEFVGAALHLIKSVQTESDHTSHPDGLFHPVAARGHSAGLYQPRPQIALHARICR